MERSVRIDVGPGVRRLASPMVCLDTIPDDTPAICRRHELALACRIAYWPEQGTDRSLLSAFAFRAIRHNRRDDPCPDLLPFVLSLRAEPDVGLVREVAKIALVMDAGPDVRGEPATRIFRRHAGANERIVDVGVIPVCVLPQDSHWVVIGEAIKARR